MASKWSSGGVSLGDVSALPGQKARGVWRVAALGDGSYFEIPVMICCGASEGPVLWAQGCIHGDEYACAVGIGDAYRSVDPALLRGALLAIPVLNVGGFLAQARCSPVDHLDMNRVFPGDERGTHTRRTAFHVLRAVEEKADCVLDMHGYRSHHMAIYFDYGNEATEAGRMMAMAAGTDAVVRTAERWLEASIGSQLTRRGIPAVIVEAPGEAGLDRENINYHRDAITNVMKHLGMMDGELVPPARPQFLCNRLMPIPAPASGLVLLEMKRGERVEKGQLLARMIDAYSDEMDRIVCPMDGMVLNMGTHGLVMAGEPLFMLGGRGLSG